MHPRLQVSGGYVNMTRRRGPHWLTAKAWHQPLRSLGFDECVGDCEGENTLIHKDDCRKFERESFQNITRFRSHGNP